MIFFKKQDWTLLALTVSAFCMGFSLPLGRVFMLVAVIGLAVDIVRGRRRLRMPATAWLWLALTALAIVVTATGPNPGKGLGKIDKLMWYIGIPLAASVIGSRAQLWSVLRALIGGIALLAARVLVRNPQGAKIIMERFEQLRIDDKFSFAQELIHLGSLSDGQRLMVGLVGAVALAMGGMAMARMGARRMEISIRKIPETPSGQKLPSSTSPTPPAASLSFNIWHLMIVLMALAEILVMKRGSWICTLAILALLLRHRLSWRWLALGVVILAAIGVGVTPIRQRITDLRSEFSIESGGRLAMWTQVAPQLLREHPQGIGFRALTNRDMRSIAPQVERNRDHLHSNFVDIAVSFGWAGLAVYLAWMALMLRDGWQADAAPSPAFWMLLGLFLNGVVEYNFADGEIVIIYGLLGGLAAAGRRLGRDEAARNSSVSREVGAT